MDSWGKKGTEIKVPYSFHTGNFQIDPIHYSLGITPNLKSECMCTRPHPHPAPANEKRNQNKLIKLIKFCIRMGEREVQRGSYKMCAVLHTKMFPLYYSEVIQRATEANFDILYLDHLTIM